MISGIERTSVLLVITSLGFGGAEMQVVSLSTQLAKRGWTVQLVTLLEPEEFKDQLATAGVQVSSLGMTRGVANPGAAFKLAHIYRKTQPAVVHSHMVHANLLARAARLIAPLEYLIATAHSIVEGGRSRELAYRALDGFCELTTNVSRAGVQRYNLAGATRPEKSLFVPNGVNLDAFKRNGELSKRIRAELGLGEKFIWLSVGRFAEEKDYPNLLRAFSAQERGSCLIMVGDGELRSSSEDLAQHLGISDRIRFLGFREDVADLMGAADAFVLSSAWEGLPLVLLEAAAVGLPIVTTDVGGTADIVRNDNGILVPPRDSRALGEAMSVLEQLPASKLRQMGTRGRQHVQETYDIDRIMDVWETIYNHGQRLSSGPRRTAFNPQVEQLKRALAEAGLT